jgi:hypothetical protein
MCALPEIFERTRVPLDLSDALAAKPETLPGTGQTLAFNMERQTQSQWCWAAVAVSVSRFYQPSTNITQCRVANLELHTDVCCANPPACNQDNTLDTSLASVGHFLDIQGAPLSFSDVQGEINAGRPLGCRIGWFIGGGHFVVINGTSVDASGGSTKRWVAVADPLYGASDYLIDNFTSAYRQGMGEWTDSYFTH